MVNEMGVLGEKATLCCSQHGFEVFDSITQLPALSYGVTCLSDAEWSSIPANLECWNGE